VHLACQLIAGKLVRKNRPTQVTGFVVDLEGSKKKSREVRRGPTNELGEVPSEPVRT
jgi:hypothetical protein